MGAEASQGQGPARSTGVDHVEGHRWELAGYAEGANLAECSRCGWVTNLRALDRDVTSALAADPKEWADIPTCDEALVRNVLES